MINPEIDTLEQSERITRLKSIMFAEERFVSLEQARIVTTSYKSTHALPRNLQRAAALTESLAGIDIRITPGELIVGNRTSGVRAGIISPEYSLRWVDEELETLPTRCVDSFRIRREDIKEFRRDLLPFWKGITLEDRLNEDIGKEMTAIGKVVEINQSDSFQGYVSPNTAGWLKYGPAGLRDMAFEKETLNPDKSDFYEGIAISLDGACIFMKRYCDLALQMVKPNSDSTELLEIARICEKLSCQPPETFHEALQSVWFLYIILHMESNASSFSPGRMDQYLYPYYLGDIRDGRLTAADALELVECLFLKFNQITHMRSSASASYFDEFPICFNVSVGGQDLSGRDATNELSHIILRAQEHLLLPQPNLSARLHDKTPERFLTRCAQVIGKGNGIPLVFNDEAVIPALRSRSISPIDARNYAVAGCVELTTMGNNLCLGNAAIFNIVKALELALNDGRCALTGKQLGAHTGTLVDHKSYDEVELALEAQIDFFLKRMTRCCETVEKTYAELLPTPFLSCVVDDCMERGLDAFEGGAFYNLSGIQVVQCASLINSLAALKTLIYDEGIVDRTEMYNALITDYQDAEPLRLRILNSAPKYGAGMGWLDEQAYKWASLFDEKLSHYTNARNGRYHMGLYTLSANIPFGVNVGATPDGRRAGQPLTEGTASAVFDHGINEPSVVFKSISQIQSELINNCTMLNIKCLPQLFNTDAGIGKFVSLLRTFVDLRIIRAQFNVYVGEVPRS